MSIRLRLTLLYTGIVALTLVAFTAAVYAVTSRVTMDAAQQALIAEAQRLASRPRFDFNQLEGPDPGFGAPPTFVQVRMPDGSVAGKTANLGDYVLPISNESMEVCQSGQAVFEVTSTGSGRMLVYDMPVSARGQYIGIVQVARSLADYDQSLDTLERILVIGTLSLASIAFGIGWLLSGAALRPIHHITETAQAIGAERDFSRRVEYEGPKDEVNWLARTFNGMLTELEGAYRQMEQSLHTQRRFVADASHELRTPLTTIRGNLGLLQREPPISAEDRVDVVNDMVDETERLMRLVNDLLLLARADARRPLRSEAVEVAPVLEDACKGARLLAPERTINCSAPAGLAVVADRDAFKQVVLILVDNALKYTPPQTPVEVEAVAAGARVALHVCDHGPGISPDARAHIFERFYRADAARTAGGAGLGLAIARALVEAQGGAISVQSRTGEGSTFTIELPRAGEAA